MSRFRIFLSYANEEREVADELSLRLRAARFEVFFDRDELPPGGSYDDRIRSALSKSDLLVFLISPESIGPGYALSELAIARKQWPSPIDHVLPVLLRPTPEDDIPPYLRTGTILRPVGNLSADVISEVTKIARRRARSWRRGLLWGGGALAASCVAIAAYQYWLPSAPYIRPDRVQRRLRTLHRRDEVISFEMRAVNPLTEPAYLDGIRIEVDGSDVRAERAPSTPQDAVALDPESAFAVGQDVLLVDAHTGEPVIEDQRAPDSWRVCWTYDRQETCGSWQDWQPTGQFGPRVASLPEPFGRQTAFVAALPSGDGFVLGANDPPRLTRLGPDGALRGEAPVELPGELTAFAVDEAFVLIGTRNPSTVAAHAIDTLERRWIANVPTFERKILSDDDDEVLYIAEVSSAPRSIARLGDGVLVATGLDTEDAGLLHLRSPTGPWEIPPFAKGEPFESRDLRLRRVGGEVWGFDPSYGPVGVYRISERGLETFSDRGYDWLDCATDVTAGSSDTLVFLSCDYDLLWVKRANDGLSVQRKRRVVALGDASRGSEYLLRPIGDGMAVALNRFFDGGGPLETVIVKVAANGDESLVTYTEFATISSFGLNDYLTIFVAELAQEEREALRVDGAPVALPGQKK